MKNKLGFELETCSRCGGTGQHSYCQMHGTTCFKCNGSGVVLTKKGATAKNFFRSSFDTPKSEINQGNKVFIDGRWCEVLKIENDEYNEGCIKITFSHCTWGMDAGGTLECTKTDGEWKEKLDSALIHQTRLTKAGKLMKKYQ